MIKAIGGHASARNVSPNPIKSSVLSGVRFICFPPSVLLCLHYTYGNFASVTFVDTLLDIEKSEALVSFALMKFDLVGFLVIGIYFLYIAQYQLQLFLSYLKTINFCYITQGLLDCILKRYLISILCNKIAQSNAYFLFRRIVEFTRPIWMKIAMHSTFVRLPKNWLVVTVLSQLSYEQQPI